MSRRSRKSKNKQSINLMPIIMGIVIALVIMAGVMFIPKITNPGEDATTAILNHEEYFANSKSLVGNKYKVVGTIKASEVLPENGDTRLAVLPEGSDKNTMPLGIFVKKDIREELENLNLDISSRYIFYVKVANNSFLEAYTIRSK